MLCTNVPHGQSSSRLGGRRLALMRCAWLLMEMYYKVKKAIAKAAGISAENRTLRAQHAETLEAAGPVDIPKLRNSVTLVGG